MRGVLTCVGVVAFMAMPRSVAASPLVHRTDAVQVAPANVVADLILRNIDRRVEQQRRGTMAPEFRNRASFDSSTQIVPFVWNAWAESGAAAPQYTVAPYLQPNSRYWVVLDLAAMSYWESAVDGTYSRDAKNRLVSLVRDWVRTSEKSVTLDAVAVTNPDALSLLASPRVTLKVDLDKVRRLQRRPALAKGITKAFDHVRAEGERSPIVFGRIVIPVQAGQRLGMTTLLLTLWDRGRPVDEIPLRFCVATDERTRVTRCNWGGPTSTDSLAGLDSLHTTTERTTRPSAAFDYVELDGRVRGVFRWNACATCDYVSFNLPVTSLLELQRNVASVVLPAFAAGATSDERVRAGAQIFNALIPARGPGDAADGDVQNEFGRFMQDALARNATEKPSLFIRMMGGVNSQATLLPFGLMAPNGQENPDAPLVGSWARIDLPLPLQTYATPNACVDNWVVAADPTLPPAQRWNQVAGNLRSDSVFVDTATFGKWLTGGSSPRTSVFVLGHQDRGRVFFSNRPGDSISATSIRREFEEPALAVLNGCSTAAPDAAMADLVTNFNRRGMSSVVATWTPVSDAMGIDYMDCFASAVATATSDAERSLAVLQDKAVACLTPRWGNRAYTYTLLGNESVRICAPRNTR